MKVLARRCWKVLAGRSLAGRSWQQRCHQALAINEQALGRIVAGFEGGFVFISEGTKLRFGFVHYAFRGSFQTVLSNHPLRHIRVVGDQAPAPGMPTPPISVAGVLGPCGPRTGNSSGM
jgi:hypothetical protein